LDENLRRVSEEGGCHSGWYEYLSKIDPEVLAYIGLNCCFDGYVRKSTRAKVLNNIGRRVEHELWADGLKNYDKPLFTRLVKQVTKAHSSEVYRFKSMRIIAAKEGYKVASWKEANKVIIASPILSSILEHTDVFEVVEVVEKLKSKQFIVMTQAASNVFSQMTERQSWAEPMFGPMVVPPAPWESRETGCYQDEALQAMVPLVRKASGEQKRAVDRDFQRSDSPDYVTALNALQATPLKINKEVLEALDWVTQENKRFGSFPEREAPAYPRVQEGASEAEANQVKKEQKAWPSKKAEALANQRVLQNDLFDAHEMSSFSEFYLPWSLDFRGRMYPVSLFNYHRDDHIKSLFMFSNGSQVDETSAGWLSIHLANCGDFDKISKAPLEDRIQWVSENHDSIMSIADDFRATFDIWKTADKPFQYLSACFEYSRLQDEGDEAFVCYLPISLDGTNSGVQHYAAALRDKDDGFMVNLVPDQKCQDLYQVVATEVTKQLKVMTREGSENDKANAQRWLNYGVSRKVVKRNVMTFAYSSRERGFGDQLIDDLMEPLQKQVTYGEITAHPFGIGKYEQEVNARFLAKVNYTACQGVVGSVRKGMEFFQAYADGLARENKSVRWTSPSGFPCLQKYTKNTTKRVRIFLFDREAQCVKSTRINLAEYTDVYDTRKSRNGIAPNVIHSQDAAHMHLSILEGLANGITDFFMIHDSFATTIDRAHDFYHCIRNAFVNMYEEHCVFEHFEHDCRQRLADVEQDLPGVPTKGSLDIQGVRESEYCFS
jgi:DNA-directed RNA polymerase